MLSRTLAEMMGDQKVSDKEINRAFDRVIYSTYGDTVGEADLIAEIYKVIAQAEKAHNPIVLANMQTKLAKHPNHKKPVPFDLDRCVYMARLFSPEYVKQYQRSKQAKQAVAPTVSSLPQSTQKDKLEQPKPSEKDPLITAAVQSIAAPPAFVASPKKVRAQTLYRPSPPPSPKPCAVNMESESELDEFEYLKKLATRFEKHMF